MKEVRNKKYTHDISIMTGLTETQVESVFKAYRLMLLHYIASEQGPDGSVLILFPYFLPFKLCQGKKGNVLAKLPFWAKNNHTKDIQKALFEKYDFLDEYLSETYGKQILESVKEDLESE